MLDHIIRQPRASIHTLSLSGKKSRLKKPMKQMHFTQVREYLAHTLKCSFHTLTLMPKI